MPVQTICSRNDCTGCGACANICPADCIRLVEDALGVLYPEVDEAKCIDCGACLGSCPANLPSDAHTPFQTWAVFAGDAQARRTSASGGAAAVLYRTVVEQGGAVFGTVFDDALRPVFKMAGSAGELEPFKGSKYVQSDTGRIFRQVREILKSQPQRTVLFIGTPCQVDGLLRFLRHPYDRLVTVDLVCHGVPPARYLQEHIAQMEADSGRKAEKITFRGERDFALTLCDAKGVFYSRPRYEDLYFSAFLKSLTYRESCYRCRYASERRVADLTIGDFWGLGVDTPYPHDKRDGVSVLLVGTEKGRLLFAQCRPRLVCEQRTREEAVQGNAQLRAPSVPHPRVDVFRERYPAQGFEKAAAACLGRSVAAQRLTGPAKRLIAKLLK